ncbi:MAG: DNA polymerase III subunit [Planctomycetota bacterium]
MSFDSIVGQDRAVGALRRALRTDRVAHAYLFTGHSGVGKMTAAVEFAKALVCAAGADDACDDCPACRKVSHGVHPDVHYVEPEGRGRVIPIKVLRDRDTGEGLLKDLALTPNEATHKVVVIDDAHALTGAQAESANCLLKTLEEPPPASVLILVTPRPDQLPETIVSRCQMIRFAPLAPGVIQEQLELRGAGAASAGLLARSSAGSLGQALRMAGENRLPEVRRELLDVLIGLQESNIVESAGKFREIVSELAKVRAEAAGTNVRTESRSMTEWLLDLAALFYRDVAVRQLGFERDQLANADVTELIDGETPITPSGIGAILDTIEEAKRLVRAYVDADAAVLDAFSRIATYRAQRAA